MSWVRKTTLISLLILALVGTAIIHAVSLKKFYNVVRIPPAYGPCKKCRDMFINIRVIDAVLGGVTTPIEELWKMTNPSCSQSKIILGSGDKVWLNCPFKIYVGPYLITLNPIVTRDVSRILYDVGDRVLRIWFDLGTGAAGYVTGFEWWHSIVYSKSRTIIIDVDLTKEKYSTAGWEHDAEIIVGSISRYITEGMRDYERLRASEIGPIYINNTQLQIIEAAHPGPLSPEIYREATIRLEAHYYYTLELGLLARAFWLNGSLVNLPSVGIVDGYIPTRYWRVLKVYPGSAFSRNEPVVLHDEYMYYIYYAIPDKVFHVVVSKEFTIVLSNASSCLEDTWCPVAEKRCGVVVLYCRARRNSLTVALPTDWNDTIEYVCTLNSTRGLVSLRLESIAVLFQNRTVIGTIYNVGSWNLTHLASGVMYSGKFPAENFVCSNSTYRVDVSKTFTLSLNSTLIARCNLTRLTLFGCSTKGPVCTSGKWSLYEAVNEPSLVWNTDSRAWRVIAYYNCSIGVKLCRVKVLAYDVNDSRYISVPIYYADYLNGTLVRANVSYTPFVLAVPCNSTLLLRAPISWRDLIFMYWRGTYVNSTSVEIRFNVTRQYGEETAFYRKQIVNTSLTCPVVLNTTLSRIWLLNYSASSSPSSSVTVTASRTCTCNCSYVCKTVNGTRTCNCTGASIRCSGSRSSSQSSSNYGYLHDTSRKWTRIIEAGTLRIPELEGSGWSMCAGLYLSSASLRNTANASVKVSVSANENSNTGCGCSTSYTVSASASSSISSLSLLYRLYGSGNIPIIADLWRSIEHTYAIDRSVSKSLNSIGSMNGSAGWSGSWTSNVQDYASPASWRIYDMYGGYYRHGMLRAVSRYVPDSSLSTYAYAKVKITHDPDEFTCNCNHCGNSCSCSISASSNAYAHAYLKLTTTVTGGRLILRAGLALPGSGWLKPRFNRLVCNNYGCIWYSNNDPWSHTGTLTITWSPQYPLPGQTVKITVTFSTGDTQPVRLWVYRVVERYWSVSEQRWVTKVYRLYLYTPWEISQAPRGSVSISFSWKMPNGYVTVCALGWGVFTRLVEECWTITPGIIVWNVFALYDYYVLTNDHAYAVVSRAILHGEAIHGPDLYYQYAIYATAYVSKCFNVKLKILDIDPSSIFLVRPRGLEVEYTHASTVYGLTTCLSPGNYLILEPAGRVVKLGSIPSNRAIILDLGPNVPSLLVDRSVLYGRKWTTYMVEVSFGQYYKIRRRIVLSLIKHVPVIDWSTDMPKVWIIAEYVYHDVPVLGTWFNYYLKCSDNYTLSIMFSNVSLHRQIIPIVGIELPPGSANNGPKVLEVSQDLLVGSCTLYVVDLPETSIPTTWHVADNYLRIYPAKSEVRIVSTLPIDHWTIYVIVDGELKKVINIGSRRSIVLYVRDFLKIRGHSIDVIVKAYPACIGLCIPEEKTVIIIRR